MMNLLSRALARFESVKKAERTAGGESVGFPRSPAWNWGSWQIPLKMRRLIPSLLIVVGLVLPLSSIHTEECCGGAAPISEKPVAITWSISGISGESLSTLTVSINGQSKPGDFVQPIYAAYGDTVIVSRPDPAANPPAVSGECEITVNSACPSPGEKKAKGTGALSATLTIKRPGQTNGEAGDAAADVGSVNLSFSMGRATDGTSAGELYVVEPHITAAGSSRAGLRFLPNPKLDPPIMEGGNLRQIKSADTIADIWEMPSGSGYEVRFYKLSDSVGQDSTTLIHDFGGNPNYVAWRVESLGADVPSGAVARLRMSKLVADAVVAGSETVYSEDSTGLIQMKTAGGKRIKSKHTLLDSINGRRIATSLIKDDQGNTLSRHVETSTYHFGDPDNDRMLSMQDGVGTEAETTFYDYNANNGPLLATYRKDAAGRIISFEKYVNGGTVRPVGGSPTSNVTPLLSMAQGDGAFSLSSRYHSYESVMGIPVSKQLVYVVEAAYIYEHTQRFIDNPGTFLSSQVARWKEDAQFPNAGRIASITDEDGSVHGYSIQLGKWDSLSETFTQWSGTPATYDGSYLEAVGNHRDDGAGSPLAIANQSTVTTTVRDRRGHVVLVETKVSNAGGGVGDPVTYATLSSTVNRYDLSGHLIETLRDGRTAYKASWAGKMKQWEKDEAGVQTTYSDFDLFNRARQVVRAGLPAADGMPAIPARTTLYEFDVEGRTTKETVSGGGSAMVREWAYDSLGRVKTEKLNGAATSYTYQPGLHKTTKTLPGGFKEITETYLDGRTKRISGTAVVEQKYTYGVNPNGTQWTKVSRGSGTDAPWTTTTTDWVGRTVQEERSGPAGDVVRQLAYTGAQLAAEQTTGLGTRTHDPLNYAGAGGAIVSKSTLPSGTDGDRVESAAEYYDLAGTEWYHVRATTRGMAPLTKVTTTVKEKVGGFGATEIAKTISIDAFGQETVSVTTVNDTTHQVRRETTRTGIANHAVSVSRAGLTQSVTSFSGTQTIYGYDGLGRQTSEQSTLSGTVNIAYEPVFGQVMDVTAGTQATHYDYYGLTEATPGRLKARTVNGQRTYLSYDGLGRQVRTWGPAAYPLWYEYDASGRLWKLHTYRTGSDALWSGAAWPAAAGAGDVTTWQYHPGTELLAQKLDAVGRGASYTYWPSGLLESRTWARGAGTAYEFNEAGELKDITYTDTDGVVTPPVHFDYDELGHLDGVTDAAGTHALEYDAEGQLKSDTMGAPGVLAGVGLEVRYVAGRFASLHATLGGAPLLGAGQTFGYETTTGRMNSVTDGTHTATYGYRPGTDWLETTTISRAGVPATVTTRTPDALGRLGTIATTRGGAVKESHTWRYNAAGQRDRDTLGDGSYWAYSYNERGEVIGGAKHFSATQPEYGNAAVGGHGYGYRFDPIGNRTRTMVNGRAAAYGANELNQYTSREVPGAVDVLGSADAGAVVSVAVGAGATQTARRQGELFSAAVPVDNSAGAQAPVVTVTGRKVTPGGPEVVSTESGKVFLAKQPESYAHDLDGNTLSDGRWNYTWDGENQLSALETLTGIVPRLRKEFAYDWHGRRIAETLKTWSGSDWQIARQAKFIYDAGWNVLMEIDGAGSVIRRCLWGLDMSGTLAGAGGIEGLLVESLASSAGIPLTDCLPFYDGNGNIIGLIDTDGNEVARYTYGPFGELLRRTGSLSEVNPFRWSTKWTDEATGLVYYGYRWLGDGRWLNRDPAGESESMNLYGFVVNDPLAFVDDLGLQKGGYRGGRSGGRSVSFHDAMALRSEYHMALARRAQAEQAARAKLEFERDQARQERINRRNLPNPPPVPNPNLPPDPQLPELCPPCTPHSKGTLGYQAHRCPPVHHPWPLHHGHYYRVNQQPWPKCGCSWNSDKTAGTPWPGGGGQDDSFPISDINNPAASAKPNAVYFGGSRSIFPVLSPPILK